MKITIKDRLVISGNLPEEQSFIGIALNRDIRKKVELTQEIITGAGMKNDPTTGYTTWDDEKGKQFDAEIEFTAAEIEHLKKIVTEKDQGHQIKEETYDTFLKIRDAKVGK